MVKLLSLGIIMAIRFEARPDSAPEPKRPSQKQKKERPISQRVKQEGLPTKESLPLKTPDVVIFESKKEPIINTLGNILGDFAEGLVENDFSRQEELSKRQRLKKKVKQKLGTILAKPFMAMFAGPMIKKAESKWMPTINPEIPQGYEEALNEKMKNPKAVLLATYNHFDHGQMIEMMFTSRMLLDIVNKGRAETNRIKGTKLIVAKSLKDGLQNAFLQAGLNRAEKDHFSKYDLSTLPCVSKNDQKRRKMNIHENTGFFKYLINLAKKRDEIIEIFVEGSVDGGRFTNGKRNGMQPLIPELDQIFEILTRDGAEIVFAPFGSSGPNRIHTDIKMPTLVTLKSLYLDKNPNNLVSVKAGMPITLTEIKQNIKEQTGQEATPEEIRDYLGRVCIAPLLPPDFQGIFRKD